MRVDTKYGWLYFRCIKEFNGMLIYLSYDGVVMFNGNSATLVSEQIRDKILELPQLQINLRQWLTSTTAEFDTGTVPSTITTADNQVTMKDILPTGVTDDFTDDDLTADPVWTKYGRTESSWEIISGVLKNSISEDWLLASAITTPTTH